VIATEASRARLAVAATETRAGELFKTHRVAVAFRRDDEIGALADDFDRHLDATALLIAFCKFVVIALSFLSLSVRVDELYITRARTYCQQLSLTY
jgi:hypothetical protein